MGPINELLKNVLIGNRASLAKAITILESKSNNKTYQLNKLSLIRSLHEAHWRKKPDTIRIAISGSPGCGKSTFIESFGMNLIENEKKHVAVLAVDPSSAIRGGSILADKTRMPTLTKNANSFIRPSPSRLHLGGVNQATGNSILMCELAGFDVVIVETVGVGQSEFEVAHLCDVFTLLVAPSAGDELQAIKKGIVEMADLTVVTKYDGDLIKAARRMRSEIRSASKYVDHNSRAPVFCVSSVTKEGINEVWSAIQEKVQSNDKLTKRQDKRLKMLRTDLINELFEILSRNLSYEDYEKRLKETPSLSLYELVHEIIYKDLYKILENSQRNE
ncbi:hypothetical protein BLOT_015308 [Blomia tropicalis]|nr:hypothetical protein BLOT_015308 [Blomia tropicalis]